MDHLVEGPDNKETSIESAPDVGRVTIAADLAPGERLRVVKFLAYGSSSRRSLAAVRDAAVAALAEARHTGWDGLLESQRAYLDDFWRRADVELEGDTELQQAVRFALFHTLQAGARAEQRAIGAKGLTGPGYDGHTFWDTERFVLPVLTYTAPRAAADALRWRHSTLDLARDRAAQLGLAGAAFPWRTIRGHECSGYWPAGTAAFHIGADIADAVVRYQHAADDEPFEREVGIELLVETARLWRSLGHHDAQGRFRIDGVTGPDEYSAIADNNVYTNLMAQRNLRAAADAVGRHPRRAAELGADFEEAATWRHAAESMIVLVGRRPGRPPAVGGVHRPSDVGLRRDRRLPVPAAAALPLLRPVPQAGRQTGRSRPRPAHVRRRLHRRGEGARLRLLRGADRSRLVAVGLHAGGGRRRGRAPRARVRLLRRGGADGPPRPGAQHESTGVHIASLAGAWIAAVAGFGGMRDHGGRLTFAPRLPPRLERLAFRVSFRGSLLAVEVTAGRATYDVLEGPPLELAHHGEVVTVTAGKPLTLGLPPVPQLPTPTQPPGRAPIRRGKSERQALDEQALLAAS